VPSGHGLVGAEPAAQLIAPVQRLDDGAMDGPGPFERLADGALAVRPAVSSAQRPRSRSVCSAANRSGSSASSAGTSGTGEAIFRTIMARWRRASPSVAVMDASALSMAGSRSPYARPAVSWTSDARIQASIGPSLVVTLAGRYAAGSTARRCRMTS
jgi:hypothetical protein